MSDILERLKELGVTRGMPQQKETPLPQPKDSDPLRALQREFPNAITGENSYGPYFLNRVCLPLSTQHGCVCLNQVLQPSQLFDSITGMPIPRREDTLAMDTETSGLSNGTGGFVFMIGMGYFEKENYVIDQLILPDLQYESAFLYQIELTFARFPILLTYNGRGFDIPMIQSRTNFHMFPDFCSKIAHVDLLLIARRYWKRRLGSVRLANIEQYVLFLKRGEQETPGYLAPELYHEFLRKDDASVLSGMSYHNQIDVLSLSAFLLYLNDLAVRGEADPSIWEENGVHPADLLRHNLAALDGSPSARRTLFTAKEKNALARAYVRESNYSRAAMLYMELADAGDANCCLKAAAILRNNLAEPEKAAFYTKKAIDLIEADETIAVWSKQTKIAKIKSGIKKK